MKKQEEFFENVKKITRLARGRLFVMKQKSKNGREFRNLQYTKGGKHFVKYIPYIQQEAYAEATENYRKFMELVDDYIDFMSARAAEEIAKEAEDAKQNERGDGKRRTAKHGAEG